MANCNSIETLLNKLTDDVVKLKARTPNSNNKPPAGGAKGAVTRSEFERLANKVTALERSLNAFIKDLPKQQVSIFEALFRKFFGRSNPPASSNLESRVRALEAISRDHSRRIGELSRGMAGIVAATNAARAQAGLALNRANLAYSKSVKVEATLIGLDGRIRTLDARITGGSTATKLNSAAIIALGVSIPKLIGTAINANNLLIAGATTKAINFNNIPIYAAIAGVKTTAIAANTAAGGALTVAKGAGALATTAQATAAKAAADVLILIFKLDLLKALIDFLKTLLDNLKQDDVKVIEKCVIQKEIVYVDKPIIVEKIVYVDKPIVTEKVVQVDKPIITEKVVQVDKQIVTEKLVQVDKPIITEKVVQVEKQIVTEKLVQVDKPIITEKLVQVEKQIVTEKLVQVDKPIITEKLVQVEKQIVTEKLVQVDKPIVTEKVVTVEKQIVTEKLVQVDKPIITEKLVQVEKPVLRDRVVTIEVPVISEKLVRVEIPVLRDKVITVEKPILIEKLLRVEVPVITEKVQRVDRVIVTEKLVTVEKEVKVKDPITCDDIIALIDCLPPPQFETIEVPYIECVDDCATPQIQQFKLKVLQGDYDSFKRSKVNKTNDLATKGCGYESVIAFPEWWAVRKGADTPQAVILLREIKKDGKWGRRFFALHIPHYNKGKDFKPKFPDLEKGSNFGELTLKGNSKVRVYAKTQVGANAFIDYCKTVIDPLQLDKSFLSLGQRKGQSLAELKTRAVRLTYFSKGREDTKPDFCIDLVDTSKPPTPT
jgi:hypothetical protein